MSFETDVLMDIADVIDSSHKTPTYVKNGVPMARVTDVKYGKLKLANALHVSSETFEEYSRRYKAKQGDIIISRVGSYGNTSWVVDTNFCLGQNVASISPTKIDPRYLYYILNSPYISEQIESLVVGSTQKSLSLKVIRELKIPRRDSIVEQSIGLLLGEIDDRINLLHETNTTLEAIAQALFKSWFVDFDPVHAKQQGRIPEGMDEATAALFPDSFEESELGLMPKGWSIGELKDVLSLRNDRTQPTDETKKLPYVPIECITAKSPFLSEKLSGEIANSSLILFKEGDILFGAMRPYFHKVCIAPFDGVTRSTVFTLTARNDKARGFSLFLAYQSSTVDYATQHSEGSTIPYAKWKNSLEKMRFHMPPTELQVEFSRIVDPLIQKANQNNLHSATLKNIRNSILPRLLSGAISLTSGEDNFEIHGESK